MIRKLRASVGRTIAVLDVERYTMLQLVGLALVVVAVGMVYVPLAVGFAGAVIFGAAYFLDADNGDEDDQPRA